MLNPHEKRSLSEGMTVVVDPEKQAKHRSIVVARLENSEKATQSSLVIAIHAKMIDLRLYAPLCAFYDV